MESKGSKAEHDCPHAHWLISFHRLEAEAQDVAMLLTN